MPKLTVCRGISGSGKTTWATKFVQENRDYQNFSRDEIRTMLCGSREIWTQGEKFENLVTKTQVAGVQAALNAGLNVVVSDTNLSDRALQQWFKVAAECKAELEIKDEFLQVPLQTCLERDAQRSHPVGAAVIRRQHAQAQKPIDFTKFKEFSYTPLVQDSNLSPAYCFDLDNTLALLEKEDKTKSNYRSPYDSGNCGNDLLNEPLASVLSLLFKAGYAIILVSGREDKFRSQTVEWLDKHSIPYDHLYMRKSGDMRKDAIIKYEIYRDCIIPAYNVRAVFDDRNQVVAALRKAGLNVYQVNEGDF